MQAQHLLLKDDLLEDNYWEDVGFWREWTKRPVTEILMYLQQARQTLLRKQQDTWTSTLGVLVQAQSQLVGMIEAEGQEPQADALLAFWAIQLASICPPPTRAIDLADVAAPARARMQSRMCQVREQGGVGCGVRARVTTTSGPNQRAASIVVPTYHISSSPPRLHPTTSRPCVIGVLQGRQQERAGLLWLAGWQALLLLSPRPRPRRGQREAPLVRGEARGRGRHSVHRALGLERRGGVM